MAVLAVAAAVALLAYAFRRDIVALFAPSELPCVHWRPLGVCALASVGGILTTIQNGAVSPFLGSGLEFTALAVVVVGGAALVYLAATLKLPAPPAPGHLSAFRRLRRPFRLNQFSTFMPKKEKLEESLDL